MIDLIYTMITLAIIGGRRHFPSVCAGRYNKTTVARILAGGAPC